MGNKISHRIIKRKKTFRTNSYPSRDSNSNAISTDYSDSSNAQLVPQLKTVDGRPYFEENFSTYIDIGCGPGHWSFEIAQEYPYAEVYGIDILSSFPSKIKPKNCHFKTCDILEGLPFDDNEFDYIFMRHMLASIKAYQWFSVLKDIKRVLKSGGVIESVELNCTPHSIGPVQTQFMKICNDAMSDAFDIDLKLKFGPMFKDLGFQNVTFTSKYISLGKWDANAGKIGQIWTTNTVQMAEAVKSILLPHMKLTDDEWDRMFKTMYFDEVDKYHSYQEHYIVLATKG
ncbi:S-adenosyl-L-methionine-dependent methyltransferase [Gigaspora margarita]|uniref:S-adenosyl-L-methionine-dependent methyltransferase n=1 Tax=Gigaspora margarita TaxID=4874 RepID=A0A8H4AY24_GIGMA|nr:S-adenosyl-L-methionine-dependent methyltransferase [Gigaspora margarita]